MKGRRYATIEEITTTSKEELYNITKNDFGYITVYGLVHGLTTNGYSVGDILWVDNTTPGALTTTPPSAGKSPPQPATPSPPGPPAGGRPALTWLNS